MSEEENNKFQNIEEEKESLMKKSENQKVNKNPKDINKLLVLPNLKNNAKTSTNQNAHEPMKKYNQILKATALKPKKKFLNKSTSLPNLLEKNINKIEKKIMNNSNNIKDNEQLKENYYKNYASMRNLNNTNKIRNNFFADQIKHIDKDLFKRKNTKNTKDSRNSKEKSINLTKNTNTKDETSKEGKTLKNFNQSKSTIFKISKIYLKKKPDIYRISQSNRHNNNKNLNSSIVTTIPKYSKFFRQSQKDDIDAHTIYKYYLNKSSSEITYPVKNYKQLFNDKSHTVMEKLKRIYCENKNFDSILKEIKSNRKIAFKNDFDIEEYQNTLLEILEKRVSQKNLIDLQDDYRDLNKKIYNIFEPKGRFTFLAEKLRYNLPSFLIEKMKQLDKDSIISRMKYYNQFKHFKKDKKLVIKFGRMDDKKQTIIKKVDDNISEDSKGNNNNS